ncbi:hypothetical protein LH19_21070 [Sphingopyxis macrogoltabida]|nr:hypothetical protein LH19_14810 [Sphingopyxis macrogoltabida]ALJ15375.1 hypothetical protein LH19_21070 [Sphingopyxis macrogoltabida]
MLTCSGEPVAPLLEPSDGSAEIQRRRDLATLAYILSLRSAWGDCWSKLSGVRAWADRLPD